MIKSIVSSVSHRISRLSANETIVRQNENYYNQALERAGYVEKIEYLGKNKQDKGRIKIDERKKGDKSDRIK